MIKYLIRHIATGFYLAPLTGELLTRKEIVNGRHFFPTKEDAEKRLQDFSYPERWDICAVRLAKA
jgi:hypothetical protein